MRNISQILDDLNIILKDAKIVSLNFDEARQCVYLALETVFTNERFLFNFKNVGRVVSLPDNFGETTINFNLNNFAGQISKPKEDKIYELKSFNDASLLFTSNKNVRSFDLVLSNQFNSQQKVHLSQDSIINGNQSINMLIWFELIELFDCNLKSLDIEIFINKFEK